MFVSNLLVDGPKVRSGVGLVSRGSPACDCLFQPKAGQPIQSTYAPSKTWGKTNRATSSRNPKISLWHYLVSYCYPESWTWTYLDTLVSSSFRSSAALSLNASATSLLYSDASKQMIRIVRTLPTPLRHPPALGVHRWSHLWRW